ncbi:MAG: 2TM domain-containing protein [Saprospiraceae bacterium]|nr:2TM domain-containing protein [Saprospiraceae bacterium]
MDSNDPYEKAKRLVHKKKGFYKHLTAFVFVNIFILGSNLLSGHLLESIPMTFFWGIGLAFHYINVFGPVGSRFDGNWEEREIEKELNRMGYSQKSGEVSKSDIDDHLQAREQKTGYDKSELV